jgi:predicted ABC-type sugar transport system permease subunit
LPTRRSGRIALSAADLDRAGETYFSIITRILAAIVALLWGGSMILGGMLGIEPGTSIGSLAVAVGVILTLLAVDQLWREVRRLQ